MDERAYYIQQHRLMHRVTKRFRGHSLVPHIDAINGLLVEQQCVTLLDYGCGKAAYWPPAWSVTGYDPAYEPMSQRPTGRYDLVLCIDVMEHIPESATTSTLREIFDLSEQWVYLSISTRTSDKHLPAGGSVHVNVKPQSWWQAQLAPYSRYTAVYTV